VAQISITRNDIIEKQHAVIKINKHLTKQFFYHQLDYSTFNLSPGDKLEYSFTITDNDEINNFKSSTSIRKTFSVPTLDSLDNLLSEQSDNIKKDMDKAKNNSKQLKDKVKEIKNDLLNKQSPDWKDKQNLQNLIQQQENLQKQIEKLNNEFNETKEQEDELLDNSEELKNKQEELQKLMDELMDEEMKDLMDELQKLMDEMNKNDLIEKLEDVEKKTETLEEELDRTLELFRKHRKSIKGISQGTRRFKKSN
jgi:chromosome segregation ATPase